MPTFVYAPGVHILIDTNNAGTLDVSDDVTQGSVTLNENQPHSLRFTLSNTNRKYDGVFTPNDKVVLQLKKTDWLQIFTGYLDSVPFYSLHARPVSLRATCTLKKLKYRLFDLGANATMQLINSKASLDINAAKDGGISNKVVEVLTKIGDWPQEDIHIGELPTEWIAKLTPLYQKIQQDILVPTDILGTGGIAGQVGTPGGTVSNAQAYTHGFTKEGAGDPNKNGALVAAFVKNIFPQQLWQTIIAISFRESSWDPGAEGDNHSHDFVLNASPGADGRPRSGAFMGVGSDGINWGPSRGLMQIRSVVDQTGTGQTRDANQLFDPVFNLNSANMEMQRAGGLGPWAGAALTQEHRDMADKALAAPPPSDLSKASNLVPFTQSVSTAPPTNDPSKATEVVSKVLYAAASQLGLPYSYGAESPGKTFDCSGLTQWAFAQAGVTLPRTSEQQWTATQSTLVQGAVQNHSLIQPGDLVFYEYHTSGDTDAPPNHVAIAISSTQQIHAPHTGDVIKRANIDFSAFMGATRPAGQGAQGSFGGIGSADGGPALAPYDWTTNPTDDSNVLSGYRLLMNDQPLLPTVSDLITASMRNFCSAPNGDFIAWFPDYFGQYDGGGTLQVEPIELFPDFTIDWADDSLITHQFVTGDVGAPFGYGNSATPLDTLNQELQTGGIVSVEFPELIEYIWGTDASHWEWLDPNKLLGRFGARVNSQNVPYLRDKLTQFWYALKLFLTNWAQQFSTNVSISFMPELWPGMRMRVKDGNNNVQFYVTQVTHTWSMSDGGGFQTSASLTSPAVVDETSQLGKFMGVRPLTGISLKSAGG